jgi:hypothetical protein
MFGIVAVMVIAAAAAAAAAAAVVVVLETMLMVTVAAKGGTARYLLCFLRKTVHVHASALQSRVSHASSACCAAAECKAHHPNPEPLPKKNHHNIKEVAPSNLQNPHQLRRCRTHPPSTASRHFLPHPPAK